MTLFFLATIGLFAARCFFGQRFFAGFARRFGLFWEQLRFECGHWSFGRFYRGYLQLVDVQAGRDDAAGRFFHRAFYMLLIFVQL